MKNSRLDIETFFNTHDIKRFFFPGKVLWGKDCRSLLPKLIEADKTIALFVDVFFADNDFVREFKQKFSKQIVILETIESMPKTENVKRIITQLGKAPDIVISIGGGSSIDTAKAVTANFIYGTFDGVGIGKKRGMSTLKGTVKPTFISLPTTAGTGADASRYYVVYDTHTNSKIYGRSWKLTADWILLDAYFILNSPERLLINSAFDSFVHFFESFICKNERSWFGDMLSIDGMARVLVALDRIINHDDREEQNYLQLLYASTMAGVAISNVRTGNIHEAAGALLEHTELTHSETLFVFLRTAYEQYHEQIKDRGNMLLHRLKSDHPQSEFESFEDIIKWWEKLFDQSGIKTNIIEALRRMDTSQTDLRNAIFNRVYSDKVWIEKESPLQLDENLVDLLIAKSLQRFGLELADPGQTLPASEKS